MTRLARTAILTIALSLCCVGALFATVPGAAGTIDPSGVGYRYVRILNDPGFGTSNLAINFGKFSTQSQYNVKVDNTGLHGFAWGTLTGWIVLDCVNTVGGCRAANGNFHVAIDSSGTLSGFAWGENTGWINFGPFSASAPRVQISNNGMFGGVGGGAGYAWSENFGWIVFDCSSSTNCLETDYRPQQIQPVDPVTLFAVLPATQTSPTPPYCQTHPTDQVCQGYVAPAPYAPPLSHPVPPAVDPFAGLSDTDESSVYDNDTGSSSTAQPFAPKPHTRPKTNGFGGIVIPHTSGRNDVGSTPTIVASIPPAAWQPKPSAPRHVAQTVQPAPRSVEISFTDTVRAVAANLSDVARRITDGVRTLMNTVRATDAVRVFSVLGIAVSAAVAGGIALFAPISAIAGGAGFLPFVLSANILSGFAVIPAARKWGTVLDDGIPLALARITLRDQAGAIVAATTTTKDGGFSFKRLAPGSYGVEVVAGESRLSLLGDQGITVGADGMPASPLSLSVAGAAERVEASALAQFLVSHEVTLTNIALIFFGAGFLASALSLVFHPALGSALVFGGYALAALLRTAGLFGSHASVFLNRVTGKLLAGEEVTVYDTATHAPLFTARTSRLGRAYIPLEKGTYYIGVKSSTPAGLSETVSAPVNASGGYLRKRFFI